MKKLGHIHVFSSKANTQDYFEQGLKFTLSLILNISMDSNSKVRTEQIMQNYNQRDFHFSLLWEHFIPSKPFCVVLSVVNCCRIYFKKSKILTPAAKSLKRIGYALGLITYVPKKSVVLLIRVLRVMRAQIYIRCFFTTYWTTE